MNSVGTAGKEAVRASTVEPRLSIVVPTHGRPRYLARALESILTQGEPGLEVLVIDDNGEDLASAGATQALVHALMGNDTPRSGRPLVRYLANGRNLGGAASRNVGVAAATAGIVAFLDDDDEWLPGHAAAVLTALAASDIDIVYSDSWVVDEARPGHRRLERGEHHEGDVRARLLEGWCPSSTSLFAIDRGLLARAAAAAPMKGDVPGGPFDPGLGGFQDYDCWLTLSLLHGARFRALDTGSVVRHRHSGARITTRTGARRVALESLAAKWVPQLSGSERRAFDDALRRLRAGIARTELVAALAERRLGPTFRTTRDVLRHAGSMSEAVRTLARAVLRGS